MRRHSSLTQIQLHQGKHSGSDNHGLGDFPYKKRAIQYLDKIKNHAVSHYTDNPKCADCGGMSQANKYPPRDNTVRHVDRASRCMELDINQCRIFVSRIAAQFAEAGGFRR